MTDPFDIDAFEERAAIAEFDGGQTRFQAETMAAQAQGVTRWQALQIIKGTKDANGSGLAGGHGHSARTMDGKRDAESVPELQPVAEEENRPMPFGKPEAGRDRGALLALRMGSGEAV